MANMTDLDSFHQLFYSLIETRSLMFSELLDGSSGIFHVSCVRIKRSITEENWSRFPKTYDPKFIKFLPLGVYLVWC